MGEIGKEKRGIDDDILQCKANILRAKDIIPPFGTKKDSKPEAFSTMESPLTPIDAEVEPAQLPKAPVRIRSIPEFEEIIPESAGQDIPQFNLAEQILAEQRKVSSSMRKGPGQEFHPETQERLDEQAHPALTESQEFLPPTTPPASPQQRVIAGIIAKDIQEMIIKSSRLK